MTQPPQGTPPTPPNPIPTPPAGTPTPGMPTAPGGQALPGMNQPSALPGMGQAAGQFAGAMAQNLGSNISKSASSLNPLALQNGAVGGLLAHLPLVLCGLLWMGYNALGGKELFSFFHFGDLTGLGSPRPTFFDFVMGMYAPLGASVSGKVSSDFADASAGFSFSSQPLFATFLVMIALYFIGKKIGKQLPLASWKDVATSAVTSWLVFIVIAVALGLLSKTGGGSDDSFESLRFAGLNFGLGIGHVILTALLFAVVPLALGAIASSTLRIAWVRRTWTYNLMQSLRSLVFTVCLSAVLFTLIALGVGIFYLVKYWDYMQLIAQADGGIFAMIVATLVGILLIIPQLGATAFLARSTWATGLTVSGEGFKDGRWNDTAQTMLSFAKPTQWWYVTLIVFLLVILIAGVHLFMKRPNARIEGAGFNTGVYALYGILLMMIPVFVMTTTLGEKAMTIRISVAGTAIITLALLGLLIDLCARYVAPHVVQAMPFLAQRYAKSYAAFMSTYGAFLAPGAVLSEEELQAARAARAQRIAEQTAAAKEKMAAQQAAAQQAAEQQRAQYAAQQAQYAAQQTPGMPPAPQPPATPQVTPMAAMPPAPPAAPTQPVSDSGTSETGNGPQASMPTPPPPPPGA